MEGIVGLLIEMKKGVDVEALINEAEALLNLGNHRAALTKFRPALAALQRSGDDEYSIATRLMMIRCHGTLEEVSWRSS